MERNVYGMELKDEYDEKGHGNKHNSLGQ